MDLSSFPLDTSPCGSQIVTFKLINARLKFPGESIRRTRIYPTNLRNSTDIPGILLAPFRPQAM